MTTATQRAALAQTLIGRRGYTDDDAATMREILALADCLEAAAEAWLDRHRESCECRFCASPMVQQLRVRTCCAAATLMAGSIGAEIRSAAVLVDETESSLSGDIPSTTVMEDGHE